MTEAELSVFARIALAFRMFITVLIDPAFARQAWDLYQAARPRDTAASVSEPAALRETNPDSALQLLGLLQRDGRLIDFLEEDVTRYSDADIGAAVRVVHQGCRKVLTEHFVIEPVLGQGEGARVTLEPGFDASSIRPTGNVVGEPPFTGTLVHCGWRAREVKLPKLVGTHDTTVLAEAEVEL
jgi:hypothetical protein